MRMTPGRILKFLRYAARPGVFPPAPGQPHVVRLDVDAADPERILPQILMKIKVNEGPVERSVEAHKYGLAVFGDRTKPIAKLSHCLFRIAPDPREVLQRSANDFHGFGY